MEVLGGAGGSKPGSESTDCQCGPKGSSKS